MKTFGRPQSQQSRAADLVLEAQVELKKVIGNETYPIEVRQQCARIAKNAWAAQAVLSGANHGDAWIEKYIDYMLGGYRGGDF